VIIFEKIIFNILAFSLFILMFFKMIRKNDSTYVYILVLQAARNSNELFRINIWNIYTVYFLKL